MICWLFPLVSDTVIEFLGLTVVQVSQNQAAVISDPQNHIFVVKDAGFVAFAIEGTFDVLSIVDQTHLPTIVKDRVTGATLGWTHEVKMKSRISTQQEKEYVVATLWAVLLFVNLGLTCSCVSTALMFLPVIVQSYKEETISNCLGPDRAS